MSVPRSSGVPVAGTAEGPPSSAWSALGTTGFVVILTQLGFYLTAAALPLYLHDIGVPQGRIGFDVGLGNLTAVGATLLLGPALDRFGPRRFLAIGGTLYVLTAAGMLGIAHEGAVAALRAVQGIGVSIITPSAYVLGAQLLPNRQTTALSLLGAANNLALAVGPPIGLALYVGHGAIWLFLPALAAAALGLVSTRLLPAARARREQPRGFGFDPAWLPLLLTNLFGVANWGGIVAYLPLYLQQHHGPNAGIFFTADAVAVLLLRIPTGILADRYGTLIPRLVGLAITLPGVAVLALPPSVPALIAAGAGTGGGAGLFITGIMGDLSRSSTDANRGTALSLSGASFSTGVFLGSVASGWLIGPGGFLAVVVFGCITCLAAFPFAFSSPARSLAAPGARE